MTATAPTRTEPHGGSTTTERSPVDWLPWAMVGIVLVGLVLRLWDLGSRPMHHDESLDAWFSWRFIEGTYEGYDPVYHGPLRFYVTGGLYLLFGDTEWTARLLPALAGAGLVATPLLLRKQFGDVFVVASAAFLALSPTFLYFSRFAREDATMALITMLLMLAVFAYLRAPRPWHPTAIILLLVAGLAVKETTFIIVFVFGSFLLAALAQQLWEAGKGESRPPYFMVAGLGLMLIAFVLGEPIFLNLGWYGVVLVGSVVVGAAWASGRGVRWGDVPILRSLTAVGILPWLIGLGAGLLLYVVSFTVFFSDWTGSETANTPWNSLVDGIRGGFEYWRSQQEVNRGGEPWNYYLFVIPAYEYLAVSLAFVGGYRVFRRPSPLGYFLVWSAVANTIAYSWASERFPWLALHPLLPMVLLAGLGVAQLWDWRRHIVTQVAGAVLAVLAVFTLIASIDGSFHRNIDPRQLLVQVQTTQEAIDVLDRVERLNDLSVETTGEPVTLAVATNESVPWLWYLRDYPDLRWFSPESGPPDDADVVIIELGDQGTIEPQLTGYQGERFPLRAWWVPDRPDGGGSGSYLDGGVGGWFDWLTSREVWNPEAGLGSSDEVVYFSDEILELEASADAS